MKPIVTFIILATFLAVGSINTLLAQTPEQLYQKGLTKEEGEGALQDAISIYNKVADNPNASISLQAKALLHIGMCYEKLGMKEATKSYQRLVNNFPAQKNEVGIARERLSKLIQITEKDTETPVAPKFMKIKIPTWISPNGRLSPDGQTLVYTVNKKLWIIPLSSNVGPDFPGKPVQLNTEGVDVDWTGFSWSGDGKWIAFNGTFSQEKPNGEKDYESIFVVPSEGGKPKKAHENYRDSRAVNYRISLSPDGRNLAFSSVENNEQYIYIKQVDGGSTKRLTEIQAREPVISPDGKWIAYVEDKNLGVNGGNLWIISATGGVPRLVANAGNASSPIWSPDGSMISYLDWTKNNSINLVQVPKYEEEPRNVTSINTPDGIEGIRSLAGWTPSDKIGVMAISKVEQSLYTIPVSGGQAALILHDCDPYQPRWSRDGKQIYYVNYPLRKRGGVLASVPASGGSGNLVPGDPDVEVIRQLPYQSGNRISPDGKMIISSAFTSADTLGYSDFINTKIWRISLDGTESKQITSHRDRYADMSPSWSPDGGKIAFIRARLIPDDLDGFDEVSIYVVSSNGGEPVMLIPETSNYIFSPVWSPDGRMIAYLSKESESYMKIINMENGEDRIVGKVSNSFVNTELAWSPDSKRIAFNDTEGKVIKIMNINNGEIEDIRTNLVDVKIHHLDWSPDGKQFVFGGNKGGSTEFWFMEDFMLFEKMAQKK